MGGPMQSAGQFLISVLFDLYIMALMLRFLLQIVRADFYNPLSQFLVKITNPVLVPARRFIPGFAGLDIACIVLILVVIMFKYLAIYGLLYQMRPKWIGLLLIAAAEFCKSILNIFFFAIIIQAVISWINPAAFSSPVGHILVKLTDPIIQPFRKLIQPISGIDLSPLFALIAIQLVSILFTEPFFGYASVMTLRAPF